MTGQSTVTATIPSYAGGSIIAIFTPQGGGSPIFTQTSGGIDSDGTFSLNAWDNTLAAYSPSTTTFIISVGYNPATSYTTSVVISGDAQDISAAFDNAPTPPSGGGGDIDSVFGRTGAVVAQTGDYSAAQISGLGSSATVDIGTTGSTVPLLSLGNTWAGIQRFIPGIATNAINNLTSGNNASIGLPLTGATISRFITDANAALTVTQTSALSTGDIVDFCNNTGVVASVSQAGAFVSAIGAPVASAATIAPTGSIFHITGTTTISTITPPPGFDATHGGVLTFIADGVFLTATGGNIANVITTVAGTAYIATWDGALWYIK